MLAVGDRKGMTSFFLNQLINELLAYHVFIDLTGAVVVKIITYLLRRPDSAHTGTSLSGGTGLAARSSTLAFEEPLARTASAYLFVVTTSG